MKFVKFKLKLVAFLILFFAIPNDCYARLDLQRAKQAVGNVFSPVGKFCSTGKTWVMESNRHKGIAAGISVALALALGLIIKGTRGSSKPKGSGAGTGTPPAPGSTPPPEAPAVTVFTPPAGPTPEVPPAPGAPTTPPAAPDLPPAPAPQPPAAPVVPVMQVHGFNVDSLTPTGQYKLPDGSLAPTYTHVSNAGASSNNCIFSDHKELLVIDGGAMYVKNMQSETHFGQILDGTRFTFAEQIFKYSTERGRLIVPDVVPAHSVALPAPRSNDC